MALGSSLVPTWLVNGLNVTASPYGVEMDGVDFGTPDLTVEVLVSFLTRGDIERVSHTGNRTLVLPIIIEGATLAALATAEAALFAAVDVDDLEVTFTPGDGTAAAFTFRAFRGSMVLQRTDTGEMAGVRRFTLTFRALPYVYSATLTTVAALAASGSTTTNVDTGSSTTGWTATVNGGAVTPSVVSGAVQAQSASPVTGPAPIAMTRTGSITTSSTKFLVVDWKPGAGLVANGLTATGDGTALPVVASTASPTTGYTRTWFSVAAASVTTLVLTASPYNPVNLTTAITTSLLIDNIDRTDIRPGSARLQARTLAIAGSAPTIGTLSIQHASTSLGDVLLYTCPDDGGSYVPWCRAAYRTAGGSVTSDSTALSGSFDTTSSATTFTIPVSALVAGEYVVMLRMKNTSLTAQIVVSVATAAVVNGTTVATGPTLSQTYANGIAFSAYAFFRLGMVHLPVADLQPNPTSAITFIISSTGAAAFQLDDLFLFNMTTGDLTQVACGTGTAASGGPANRLWIDSPGLANGGLGRYMVGFASDRSDSFSAYPAMASQGVHRFTPSATKVFAVTTNTTTTGADIAFQFYAAWANHAAS